MDLDEVTQESVIESLIFSIDSCIHQNYFSFYYTLTTFNTYGNALRILPTPQKIINGEPEKHIQTIDTVLEYRREHKPGFDIPRFLRLRLKRTKHFLTSKAYFLEELYAVRDEYQKEASEEERKRKELEQEEIHRQFQLQLEAASQNQQDLASSSLTPLTTSRLFEHHPFEEYRNTFYAHPQTSPQTTQNASSTLVPRSSASSSPQQRRKISTSSLPESPVLSPGLWPSSGFNPNSELSTSPQVTETESMPQRVSMISGSTHTEGRDLHTSTSQTLTENADMPKEELQQRKPIAGPPTYFQPVSVYESIVLEGLMHSIQVADNPFTEHGEISKEVWDNAFKTWTCIRSITNNEIGELQTLKDWYRHKLHVFRIIHYGKTVPDWQWIPSEYRLKATDEQINKFARKKTYRRQAFEPFPLGPRFEELDALFPSTSKYNPLAYMRGYYRHHPHSKTNITSSDEPSKEDVQQSEQTSSSNPRDSAKDFHKDLQQLGISIPHESTHTITFPKEVHMPTIKDIITSNNTSSTSFNLDTVTRGTNNPSASAAPHIQPQEIPDAPNTTTHTNDATFTTHNSHSTGPQIATYKDAQIGSDSPIYIRSLVSIAEEPPVDSLSESFQDLSTKPTQTDETAEQSLVEPSVEAEDKGVDKEIIDKDDTQNVKTSSFDKQSTKSQSNSTDELTVNSNHDDLYTSNDNDGESSTNCSLEYYGIELSDDEFDENGEAEEDNDDTFDGQNFFRKSSRKKKMLHELTPIIGGGQETSLLANSLQHSEDVQNQIESPTEPYVNATNIHSVNTSTTSVPSIPVTSPLAERQTSALNSSQPFLPEAVTSPTAPFQSTSTSSLDPTSPTVQSTIRFSNNNPFLPQDRQSLSRTFVGAPKTLSGHNPITSPKAAARAIATAAAVANVEAASGVSTGIPFSVIGSSAVSIGPSPKGSISRATGPNYFERHLVSASSSSSGPTQASTSAFSTSTAATPAILESPELEEKAANGDETSTGENTIRPTGSILTYQSNSNAEQGNSINQDNLDGYFNDSQGYQGYPYKSALSFFDDVVRKHGRASDAELDAIHRYIIKTPHVMLIIFDSYRDVNALLLVAETILRLEKTSNSAALDNINYAEPKDRSHDRDGNNGGDSEGGTNNVQRAQVGPHSVIRTSTSSTNSGNIGTRTKSSKEEEAEEAEKEKVADILGGDTNIDDDNGNEHDNDLALDAPNPVYSHQEELDSSSGHNHSDGISQPPYYNSINLSDTDINNTSQPRQHIRHDSDTWNDIFVDAHEFEDYNEGNEGVNAVYEDSQHGNMYDQRDEGSEDLESFEESGRDSPDHSSESVISGVSGSICYSDCDCGSQCESDCSICASRHNSLQSMRSERSMHSRANSLPGVIDTRRYQNLFQAPPSTQNQQHLLQGQTYLSTPNISSQYQDPMQYSHTDSGRSVPQLTLQTSDQSLRQQLHREQMQHLQHLRLQHSQLQSQYQQPWQYQQPPPIPQEPLHLRRSQDIIEEEEEEDLEDTPTKRSYSQPFDVPHAYQSSDVGFGFGNGIGTEEGTSYADVESATGSSHGKVLDTASGYGQVQQEVSRSDSTRSAGSVTSGASTVSAVTNNSFSSGQSGRFVTVNQLRSNFDQESPSPTSIYGPSIGSISKSNSVQSQMRPYIRSQTQLPVASEYQEDLNAYSETTSPASAFTVSIAGPTSGPSESGRQHSFSSSAPKLVSPSAVLVAGGPSSSSSSTNSLTKREQAKVM